ncbi:hypothetical protein IL306_009208 [Fusarium sp. DS 682]|nr:hypothetical protein IL306_009208 [Fusarium sp. DS 682]
MAKFPEGSFNKTTDNILTKVTPWVVSLPNDYVTEGSPIPDSSEEPQQAQPNIVQRGKCLIPSSDLKRHVGQHLERLALFALNRSKLMPDDGKSARTEDAVARSESSFESLQSLDSMNSNANQGSSQAGSAVTVESDSKLAEIARFEDRYQMADYVPVKVSEIQRRIRETLVKSEFDHRCISEPLFFSPEGSLESIITVELVLWTFCNEGERPSYMYSDHKPIVDYTLGRGMKLLSILVLSGFEGKRLWQAMYLFLGNEFRDERLPLEASDLRNLVKSLPQVANIIKYRWNTELENLWDAESINNFCNNHQWKFCAPVFFQWKPA